MNRKEQEDHYGTEWNYSNMKIGAHSRTTTIWDNFTLFGCVASSDQVTPCHPSEASFVGWPPITKSSVKTTLSFASHISWRDNPNGKSHKLAQPDDVLKPPVLQLIGQYECKLLGWPSFIMGHTDAHLVDQTSPLQLPSHWDYLLGQGLTHISLD